VARVEIYQEQIFRDPYVLGQVLPMPSQNVTNWIWLMIIGAFALVFVGNAGALIAAIFALRTPQAAEHIQILLTVFTTVAGILAGFISGRASTGGSAR
jgi:hypothetical protein